MLGHTAGGRLVPPWPGGGRTPAASTPGSWVAWRLLGSNHRELARSAAVYADLVACAQAAASMQGALAEAVPEPVIGTAESMWSWTLHLSGKAVAVASRVYLRQRECEYSFRVFAEAVGAARGLPFIPADRTPSPVDGAPPARSRR